MDSPFDLRREGVSGRSQARPMTEEERARRVLVYEWTGHHETDYLIEQACGAPKGRRLKAAVAAVECLARIAAHNEDQFAVADLVIDRMLERSGYGRRPVELKRASEHLKSRFLAAYQVHRAPFMVGRVEPYAEMLRRAAEQDRAEGNATFDQTSAAWEEATLSVGDEYDPYFPVEPVAAELYSALPDDVPWKARERRLLKVEKHLHLIFRARRHAHEDRLESLRNQFPQRRYYAVDPPAPKPKDRFEITLFGEIEENPVKEWLIDGMLGDGEFSCFWGMPGCGKSVIVGDAAFHVAAGLPWFDRPVRQGLVVYIAAERAELTKRRLAALRKKHGRADAPLAVIKGRLDLTSGLDDAKAIIEAVREVERRTGQRCVWLILDTVARTFGAGDENAATDMGAYVKACDLVKDEVEAHVSLVHHCSRTGEKPRGSIALDGAVDATFKVSKNGGVHSVVLDKENDAPEAGVIRFTMEAIELGRDRNDKPTMAPVVVRDNSTVTSFVTADGVKVSLGRNKPRKAALVLAQALEEAGQDDPRTGRRAVAESELRKRLRDAFRGPKVKENSLDTIVRRSLRELVEKGDAEKIGEWFFPVQTEQPKAEEIEG